MYLVIHLPIMSSNPEYLSYLSVCPTIISIRPLHLSSIWNTYPSIPSIYLSTQPSYLSIHPSIHHLHHKPCISIVSIHPSSISIYPEYLSINWCISQPICIIYLSFYPSLSIYDSICLPKYHLASIYLPIHLSEHHA